MYQDERIQPIVAELSQLQKRTAELVACLVQPTEDEIENVLEQLCDRNTREVLEDMGDAEIALYMLDDREIEQEEAGS